jgi:hypothetical protein
MSTSLNETTSVKRELSCLSYQLIGLSPAYWTYNPLLIITIHKNIILIKGINVFVLLDRTHSNTRDIDSNYRDCNDDANNNDDDNNNNSEDDVMFFDNIAVAVNTQQNNISNGSKEDEQEEGKKKEQDLLIAKHMIPMNKCEIVGVLQYVQYKSNGLITMVLDDGTGLIDCTHWQDDDDEFYNSILTSISGNCNKIDEDRSYKYNVGDLVRIRGQIHVLGIDHDSQMVVKLEREAQCDRNECNHVNDNSTLWEGYLCTREIQVHFIEKIIDLNEESVHWLRSLQFIKRIENTVHIQDGSNENNGLTHHIQEVDNELVSNEEYCTYDEGWEDRQELRLINTPVYDGYDVFNVLSNEMKNEIVMPITESTVNNNINHNINEQSNSNHVGKDGSENTGNGHFNFETKMIKEYFGRQCRCHEVLDYMDELLYCHCLASNEALDKKMVFRDALLTKLLEMESIYCGLLQEHQTTQVDDEEKEQKQEKQNTHVDEQLNKQKQNGKEKMNYFQFNYTTIYKDETLLSIAKETISQTSDPKTNLRRLFINTFQRLRNDGILYLMDVEQDIYILLSKTRVLLPSIKNIIVQEEQYKYREKIRLESSKNSAFGAHDGSIISSRTSDLISPSVPSYLSNLPNRKFWLIKRIAWRQRNGHGS